MATLALTLIQSNLVWEDKVANRHAFEQKLQHIKSGHVVVLPEMFSTGFSMRPEALAETMEGETVTWMKGLAAAKKIILTGSLIIEDDGAYYNRMLWVLPNGQVGYYNKRHLFAFAGEHKYYTSGNHRKIAQVNGWRVNLQVCYDLRFPVWARQTFTEADPFEYDLLLYVANWPQRRSHAWKTLLQARAIENQCYVVGVNRVGDDGNGIYHSGDSMVIDPLGEVLYHKMDDEDIFSITLEKETLDEVRQKFQFWRDKDDFKLLL